MKISSVNSRHFGQASICLSHRPLSFAEQAYVKLMQHGYENRIWIFMKTVDAVKKSMDLYTK